MNISYDTWLAEEAVFRATRDLPPQDRRLFDQARVRIYEIRDRDEREARFRRLHEDWFRRLGLHRTLERAVSERPGLAEAIVTCLVMPAVSRKEELADLWSVSTVPDDSPAGRADERALVVRLRPESLLDPDGLLAFLRHELMHVADMLDPAFGYERALPISDAGPSYDNILRDRYRILWDTTIDGRLVHAGQLPARARDVRLQEFAQTFRYMGGRVAEEFSRWFDNPAPHHREMVSFVLARHAGGNGLRPHDARCPVCRFPVAALDPHPERLSADTVRGIQARHRLWQPEDGLCSQCADLYEARQIGP